MTLEFTQDPSGESGTVDDVTVSGSYPAPNTSRGDAANYLLFSKTDQYGVRTFYNPDFGAVLSIISWAVLTAVSGLYEAILLRIKQYDNAVAYLAEVESGGIISQDPSVVYYPTEDKVYRCIADSTGHLPTDTDYWEEVTELSELIDNDNIDQEILNINSDKLIDKTIASRLANGGCACSDSDVELNNKMISLKRKAEIFYESGNIYEYEKVIAQLIAIKC